MYHVLITVPCDNQTHARGVKRMMDYALAGLYYNKAVRELLSSEIVASRAAQEQDRKARSVVDLRKQLALVPKPSKAGEV